MLPDKIIFYLDNDLRQFCLSYYLQKKIDADFFSIIDITNKPKKFFENQNFVSFKKIWFLHDHTLPISDIDTDYLKSFEEKYEIDLWNLAINERLFYRFNDFYNFSKLIFLCIRYWDRVIFRKYI